MRTELKEVTNFYRGYSSKQQGEIMEPATLMHKYSKNSEGLSSYLIST